MLDSFISKRGPWLGLETASYTVGMVKISLHRYNLSQEAIMVL